MNEPINLKGLEKKAWRSTYQDGIWDIYFGLLFFGIALAPFGENLGISSELGIMLILILWYSIAVIFLMLGKKYITIPRIGYVKFGARRKKVKKALLGLLIFNIFLALLFLIIDVGGIFTLFNIEGLVRPLIIGLLLITTPLSILAYFLQYYRLYPYALSFGLSFFFSELLYPLVGEPLDLFISQGLVGIVILIIGLIYFIQFLLKYPLSQK